MSIYVDIQIPYSQLQRRWFTSKEEAGKWLAENPGDYQHDLENVEVYQVAAEFSPYDLVKSARGE